MNTNIESDGHKKFLEEKRNKLFLELRTQLGLRDMKVRNLRDDDVILIANPDDPTQLFCGVYRSGSLQAFTTSGFQPLVNLTSADDAYYASHHDYFEESTHEPEPDQYEGAPGWWELIHDDLVAEVVGGDKPDLAVEQVHMAGSVHPDDVLLYPQNGVLVIQLGIELRIPGLEDREAFAVKHEVTFPVERIRMFDFDGDDSGYRRL